VSPICGAPGGIAVLAGIAGGKVFTGEEIGEFAGEFIGGAGLGVFAGVVGAEVGMTRGSGECGIGGHRRR